MKILKLRAYQYIDKSRKRLQMEFRYIKNWMGLTEIEQRIVGEMRLYSAIKSVSTVKTSLTFKCLIEHLLADFSYSRPLDTYL